MEGSSVISVFGFRQYPLLRSVPRTIAGCAPHYCEVCPYTPQYCGERSVSRTIMGCTPQPALSPGVPRSALLRSVFRTSRSSPYCEDVPHTIAECTSHCVAYPALLRGAPRNAECTPHCGAYPALTVGRTPQYYAVYPYTPHYCGVHPPLLWGVARTAECSPRYCGAYAARSVRRNALLRGLLCTAESTPHCGDVPRTIAGCTRSLTTCSIAGCTAHYCGVYATLLRRAPRTVECTRH